MNLLLLFGGWLVLFVAGFEIGARWATKLAQREQRPYLKPIPMSEYPWEKFEKDMYGDIEDVKLRAVSPYRGQDGEH